MISVVIDSYNTSAFIGEAIGSVQAQTCAPDEIIVADASADGSPAIIRDYAARDQRVKPVFIENRGQLATILAGVERAGGEWIFILDGDDAYKPDHLEKRLRRIEQFPDADLIYGRHEAVGDEELLRVLRSRDKHENADWLGPIDLEQAYDWGRSTALSWCTPNCHVGGVSASLSIRLAHFSILPLRRLCEETGYRLQANADYMILLASSLYGGRKVYAPERTVSYRVHGSSITGSYAAGHDPSLYIQRCYCSLARNWLCALPQFGPSLYDLLDLEMTTVPQMSVGHRAMYERAKSMHLGRWGQRLEAQMVSMERKFQAQLASIRQRREAKLEHQIASMQDSVSWKLTAPLRVAGKFFGLG